ncbi:MAG: hypothetical protein JW838_15705 [Spirochaetes bacterium]|nr:hypothetical protein [Spirochaetota bacterium]
MINKHMCIGACIAMIATMAFAGPVNADRFSKIEKNGKQLQGGNATLHVTLREVTKNGGIRVADRDGQLRTITISSKNMKKMSALKRGEGLKLVLKNLTFKGNRISGTVTIRNARGLIVDDTLFFMICSSEHKW